MATNHEKRISLVLYLNVGGLLLDSHSGFLTRIKFVSDRVGYVILCAVWLKERIAC